MILFYQAKEPGAMHDPEGLRCPFGAHVRRSNPRDTLGEDRVEALKLNEAATSPDTPRPILRVAHDEPA